MPDLLELPFADVAALLRRVPPDELPEFRSLFEAATRDLSHRAGRGGVAWVVLIAIDAAIRTQDADAVWTLMDDAAVDLPLSSAAGTLRLAEDETGLVVDAPLVRAVDVARELVENLLALPSA